MDKTREWIKRENQHCAQNYAPLPVVLSRGEGVWVWDTEGKRYCDMMSAYSAVSFGHCHPRLVRALTEQASHLCVVSRAFYSDRLAPFLEKLCALSSHDMGLVMNTGVEAVETALKAARRFGYEKKGIPDNTAEIIVAKNNFHGRTLSVISFSSEKEYQKHFGPFTPGFVEVPYNDAKALEDAITPNTCAFLVEPFQGEAGIILPSTGYLAACEKICRENNVLLMLDEIQTGLGRTGKCFASEHDGVKADVLILGKALGGGMLPLSCVLARKEIMDIFVPGSHGSTFGGNPLAVSVGLEVLHLLEDEHLVENSARMGEFLLAGLKDIQHPLIKDIRGKGLFVGVELNSGDVSAHDVCLKLLEKGLLCKDVHDTVIRFAPPLVIDKTTLEWALEQIRTTFDAI